MTLRRYLHAARGRQVALARALRVSPSLVSMWASGARRIPIARCLTIERATRGQVRAGGLRRDYSFTRPKRS